MQDAHVPRRIAEPHGRRRECQLDNRGHAPVHAAPPAHQELAPQRQGREHEEQRDAVLALSHACRDSAVGRPDQRAGKGQPVAQGVVLHVLQHARQVHAALAPQHPANAGQRHQQPRHHEPVGALPVEQDGRHHGESGPEVVDHAHLDGLLPRVGVADRQRQAQLIGNKQQAAPEQVAPGHVAQPREAHRGQQQRRGDGVDHGRASRGPQPLADATDQPHDGGPQDDGDEADERGSVLANHGRGLSAGLEYAAFWPENRLQQALAAIKNEVHRSQRHHDCAPPARRHFWA